MAFGLGSLESAFPFLLTKTTSPNSQLLAAQLLPLLLTDFGFLLRELCIPILRPVQVFFDNLSTTYMASNPIQDARTKDIEIDLNFVREHVW